MTKTTTTQNQDNNELPQFTGTIRVEVSVNTIYEKMLNTLPVDYKHREILAHAIIGSAAEKGTVGFIYNALAGFTNEINYKVGDLVICTSKERRVNEFTNQSPAVRVDGTVGVVKPIYKDSSSQPIGNCKVVEVNMYATNKLKVEYQQHEYRSDAIETTHSWVSVESCKHVPSPMDAI